MWAEARIHLLTEQLKPAESHRTDCSAVLDVAKNVGYALRMIQLQDYRELIRAELDRRTQADARYSLRAFASDLKLAPSRLSEVLSGKQGLSRKVALRLAPDLGLDAQRAVVFADLVESEHARSEASRTMAKVRLELRAVDAEYLTLQEDNFRAISEWYHFAIFQLCECKGFRDNENWVAQRFGIKPFQARDALDRLLRMEILQRSGKRIIVKQAFICTTDNVPSSAIRLFHEQILKKAEIAIGTQDVGARNFSANVIAFDSARMPEAKTLMKNFRRRFVDALGSPTSANTVYCLSMQFFRLTTDGK